LDKLHPNFDLQKDVFLKQIDIAETQKKPIIIHCVKAYSELLEILKSKNLKILSFFCFECTAGRNIKTRFRQNIPFRPFEVTLFD
jgi:Tat protein secretion system quality control protein TatD with DNase activity